MLDSPISTARIPFRKPGHLVSCPQPLNSAFKVQRLKTFRVEHEFQCRTLCQCTVHTWLRQEQSSTAVSVHSRLMPLDGGSPVRGTAWGRAAGAKQWKTGVLLKKVMLAIRGEGHSRKKLQAGGATTGAQAVALGAPAVCGVRGNKGVHFRPLRGQILTVSAVHNRRASSSIP